ncbi:AzlD domain-containing protein [Neptuniibacter caesariensis]|uniref:Branched-chain amino acid ABC transporter n=1 Tax=Neptuniibacter caesariensis TaxID=207954 RepID=A0A7U8C668_NEPCE|nr:AzlD domain-containing protein [Neptuniibacter caesariensis]EAR60634.1 hypothetical protein MED92_09526 [Oceanospirillum sp. MED92] [Neptuniibacter caesariensis]
MNYWLLIIAMTGVVFTSRYLFLEPKLPLKLSDEALRVLSYSAPAVLSAVIGPLVFTHEGALITELANPYLIGAVTAVVLMLLTKNTLLTAVLSMTLFLIIN